MLFRDDLRVTFKVGYRRYDICVEMIEDDYNIMRDIDQCIERNNINDFSEVYVSFRGVAFRLSCTTLEHFKTVFGCMINNCYEYYLDGDRPYNYHVTNYREKFKEVDLLQETSKSLPICVNTTEVNITLINSFMNPIGADDFNDDVIKRVMDQLIGREPEAEGVWRFYILDDGIQKVCDVEFYSNEGFYRAVYDMMVYLCSCSKIKQSRYSSLKHVFYNTKETDVTNYFSKIEDAFETAINKMKD